MPDPLRPLRLAARSLRRTPAFTLLAVLTIALGVGATTAVFSMVHGLLLRRLPYGNDGRLLRLVQPSADRDDATFSVPEIEDYRARLRSVETVSEYHSMPFQLYGRGEPQRVLTGVVNADFFALLGVRPLHGRLFLPGEDALGAPNVLVLSHRYWRERFGGDPAVVGQTFTMNDRTATVIGVLPPLPVYPDDNDLWMPASACPFRSAPAMMAQRDGRMLNAFALLRPGVSLDAATRELTQVSAAMHREHPGAYPAAEKLSVRAVRLRDELTRPARRLVLTLLASAGFLLVVAAANLANLTLSRQLRRSRELALRAALGAGRGRLFGQLAAESLLVTLTGGALGVGLAYGGLGLLRAGRRARRRSRSTRRCSPSRSRRAWWWGWPRRWPRSRAAAARRAPAPGSPRSCAPPRRRRRGGGTTGAPSSPRAWT
jgi:putative ABC transport system permease protein